MLDNGLIDTGAIVAILDRDDAWHRRCIDAFTTLRLPLVTSMAVLAETFHLVGDDRRAVAAAWRFVRSGALTVAGLDDGELPALAELMAKYHDRQMDLADATLVHLAQREGLSTILTVDHDDFETYRLARNKRFRVLPGR